MKILLFGDFHIRESNEYSTLEPDGYTSLLHECEGTFDWLFNCISEHNVGAVVNVGDLFHTQGYVNGLSLNVGYEGMSKLYKACHGLDIPLISLVGNHEWIDMEHGITTVPFLSRMGMLVTSPVSLNLDDDTEEMALFLPYSANFDFLRKKISDYLDMCSERGIAAPLIISHLDVIGGAMGSIYSRKGISLVDIGPAIMVNGHHHTPQVITDTNMGTIVNMGSVMYTDFKDQFDASGQRRGALLYDTDPAAQATFHWLPNPHTSIFYTITPSGRADLLDKISEVMPNPKMNIRIIPPPGLSVTNDDLPARGFRNIKIIDTPTRDVSRLKIKDSSDHPAVWSAYVDYVGVPQGVNRDNVIAIGSDILRRAAAKSRAVTYEDVKIKSWRAVNFMSANDVTITLPSDNRVITVLGERRDTQAMRSNGSGKSSLFEAIPFALWGELVRDYRSMDEVINTTDGKKGAMVSVKFEVGRKECEVIRTRKWGADGDSLRLIIDDMEDKKRGTPAIQKDINDIVGMTFTEYKQLVALGGREHFSDIKNDTKRKDLLDAFIGTGVYSTAEDIATTVFREIDSRKDNLVEVISNLGARIEAINDDIANLSQLKAEADKQVELKVAGLQQKVKMLTEKRQQLKEDLLDVKGGMADVGDRAESSRLALEKQKSELNKLAKTLAEKRGTIASKMEDRRKLKDLYDAGRCDKCGTKLVKARLSENLVGLDEAISRLKAEVDEGEQDFEVRSEECDKLEVKFNGLLRKRSDMQREVSRMGGEIAGIDSSLSDLQDEMDSIKISNDDIFSSKIEGRKKEMEATVEALGLSKDELQKVDAVYSDYLYVSNNFTPTTLRSYVLDRAISQANQYLTELSMAFTAGEIPVQITSQKDQKKKTVSKIDFAITMNAPSFGMASSGERRRMDLMIQFALSELSRKYRNAFNIMVIDEEDAGLDSAGMEYFFNVLSSVDRVVFLVSHQLQLQTAPRDRITAIREGGRTEYIVEIENG